MRAGRRPRGGKVNTTRRALVMILDEQPSDNAAETALLEEFMGMPDTPENRKKFLATIPMGRLSQPKDVANAALYLASDEAEFINGVCLEVDGGRCV